MLYRLIGEIEIMLGWALGFNACGFGWCDFNFLINENCFNFLINENCFNFLINENCFNLFNENCFNLFNENCFNLFN